MIGSVFPHYLITIKVKLNNLCIHYRKVPEAEEVMEVHLTEKFMKDNLMLSRVRDKNN